MDLTVAQWKVIAPLLPKPRVRRGRGRPWRDPQDVLNGILWVLRTGALWAVCRRAIRRIKPVIGDFSSG
jgi:transposase